MALFVENGNPRMDIDGGESAKNSSPEVGVIQSDVCAVRM